MKKYLAGLLFTAAVLAAAETPKADGAGMPESKPAAPAALTDSQKLEIRTLQLRAARIETAKLQLASEEAAVNGALTRLVQEHAARGCTLQEDLTCSPAAEPPKPEPPKTAQGEKPKE
jgi:hypothetical protein